MGITMHCAWRAQGHGGWKEETKFSPLLIASYFGSADHMTLEVERQRRLGSLAALSARLLTRCSDSP